MRHESSTVFPSRPARRIAPALMLCVALLAPSLVSAKQPAAAANAAVVATWNEIAVTTVTGPAPGGAGMAGPTAFNYFAFTQIAIYNAVVGITGEYELYRWNAKAPEGRIAGSSRCRRRTPGASPLLRHRHALRHSTIGTNLDARLAASLALVPDGVPKDQGIRYGIRAADHIIALRANDGRGAAVVVPPATEPGDWRPTPSRRLRRSRPPGSARSHRLPWTRSIGSIPARRRRSARDLHRRSSRRCVLTGDINAPLTVRTVRDDTDGEVLLRCGHHRDAAWACRTLPGDTGSTSTTAPACSRPPTPRSPMGPARYGTPSSSTCGGDRSPPSRPTRTAMTTVVPRLVAAHHHPAVSRLAQRPLLRRRPR